MQISDDFLQTAVSYDFFYLEQLSPLRQSILIHEVSTSHTTHHIRYRLLWTSD